MNAAEDATEVVVRISSCMVHMRKGGLLPSDDSVAAGGHACMQPGAPQIRAAGKVAVVACSLTHAFNSSRSSISTAGALT